MLKAMDIYTLMAAPEVAADLGERVKSKRLAHNLTLVGLSERSGVPLGTLKKFERTGVVSLVSFVRLVVALGEQAGLERMFERNDQDAITLDQLMSVPRARRRGRIN